MNSRLTQFDRTFRHAKEYHRSDAAAVRAEWDFVADIVKPPQVPGAICAAFTSGKLPGTGTMIQRMSTGKANAHDISTLENRTHYIAMQAFAEYMSKQEEPRNFNALMPAFDAFVAFMSQFVNYGAQESLNTTIQMYYQQAGFMLAQKPVYEVSPGLALELLDTELRGLSRGDLRLPFETVYIHAPDETGLKIFNDESQWHELDGIYITEDEDDGVRSWRFLLVGRPKPVKRSMGPYGAVDFDNDALLHWRFEFRHESLEECINAAEQEMIAQTESEAFKKIIPLWRELFRFAMNTILYATMPDADVERVITDEDARRLFARIKRLPKGKKKSRLQERLKGMDTSTRYQLGRTIRIDRAVSEARASAGVSGRTLKVQFRRTGHFRNQPYGEGRKLIKRIWIKPCWVGGKDKPLSMPRRRLEKPCPKQT